MEAACIRIMKNCHVSERSSLAHARITTPLHQCGHKAPWWVSVLCLMAPRCKLCRSRGGQGGVEVKVQRVRENIGQRDVGRLLMGQFAKPLGSF